MNIRHLFALICLPAALHAAAPKPDVIVATDGTGQYTSVQEAINTAISEATTPTADYLMGMPHLAENLESGLDALGVDVSGEEEDFL